MIEQVNTDSLLYIVSGLSGETGVTIAGEPDSLPCRYAPYSQVTYKAARWLADQFEIHGLEPELVEFSVNEFSFKCNLPIGTSHSQLKTILTEGPYSDLPSVMWNVVTTIPGADSEQILFTAHYDAISEQRYTYTPGADDNGSGVAGVLEAARIMSKHDWQHTLKFVLFSGEEVGLYGSQAYAKEADAKADPIIGVLNLDMIAYDGWGEPDIDIHCRPYDEVSIGQGQILADAMDIYDLDLIPELHHADATNRSDHASFWPFNIPAMLLVEDYFGGDATPFYHTTQDRISSLNVEYFTEGVKASVAWAAIMAEMIPDEPVVTESEPETLDIASLSLPSQFVRSQTWMEIKTPHTVTPAIYDASGRRVKILASVNALPDPQRIYLNLSNLEPGIYWIRIPGTRISQKLVLLR
ncbi:M20/M25/M40 family metallo-hydrolase [candidate division WOR-3 bacterium]|nr:M20/M25/M40 family metallo-hydrolase [candidate division WOR-3 bacterium]